MRRFLILAILYFVAPTYSLGQVDEYALDHRGFDDPKEGFSLAIKLLNKANKADAPPETIAQLRYKGVFLARTIEFKKTREDKDYAKTFSMLRGVVNEPDRFLVNYQSAQWYQNCLGLLISTYDLDNRQDEADKELRVALARIAAADNLTEHEKLMIQTMVRMTGSDHALKQQAWQDAVQWVQPVFDRADEFLLDEESAARLAMSTRQQSMFLVQCGENEACIKLVDQICTRIDEADCLSESKRLGLLCMLRGKQLVNFDQISHKENLRLAWDQFDQLTNRVIRYDGDGRSDLDVSFLNMIRLAIMVSDDLDKSYQLGMMAMETVGGQSPGPDGRALAYIRGICSRIVNETKRAGHPKADEFLEAYEQFKQEHQLDK